MKLLDCFERLYVISLPHQGERRERLVKNLVDSGLAIPNDINWVRGVSGDVCHAPHWFQAGSAAWGCLQSHLRIAQDSAMDGLCNYLVLEDDAIFSPQSSGLLERLVAELPADWGQLYLGGQHLKDPETPNRNSFLCRCNNVNRTHAYALHQRAFISFQQHVMDSRDYLERGGGWHIDHQLGLAHERREWATYAPLWWITGQAAGTSTISGTRSTDNWWQPSCHGKRLPFIHLPYVDAATSNPLYQERVYFGSRLKDDTLEDCGLDSCVDRPEKLRQWLETTAGEAINFGRLAGICHPRITVGDILSCWPAGLLPESADFPSLADDLSRLFFEYAANNVLLNSLRPAGSAAA